MMPSRRSKSSSTKRITPVPLPRARKVKSVAGAGNSSVAPSGGGLLEDSGQRRGAAAALHEVDVHRVLGDELVARRGRQRDGGAAGERGLEDVVRVLGE